MIVWLVWTFDSFVPWIWTYSCKVHLIALIQAIGKVDLLNTCSQWHAKCVLIYVHVRFPF